MKLYGFAPSPNTWQVRALATHIGVPLDFLPLDFAKGDTKTPAFLAINPTGRTPALIDGDFKLWETLAVMQYVAGKKAESAVAGRSAQRAPISRAGRAGTSRTGTGTPGRPSCPNGWSRSCSISARPTKRSSPKASRRSTKKPRCSTRIWASKSIWSATRLRSRTSRSVAPLFYAKEAELPLGPYPHLRGWSERVMALPCWSATAPQFAAAA